jgi:hypothetical protein
MQNKKTVVTTQVVYFSRKEQKEFHIELFEYLNSNDILINPEGIQHL